MSEQKAPAIKTVDITPTWTAVVKMYLRILRTTNVEQFRQDAEGEIMRAAGLADLYVASLKNKKS